MGLIYYEGIVKNEKGNSERVRFLIDSGAYYTVLKKDIWQKPGFKGNLSGFSYSCGWDCFRKRSF